MILLDLMLPKISGEQLCTKWRQDGLQTPIIMLTAKGQEKEKISGLNLGADDYITKPFSLEELLARIEAILRRTRSGQGGRGIVSRSADGRSNVAKLKIINRKEEHRKSPSARRRLFSFSRPIPIASYHTRPNFIKSLG